jgi:hypothetical protein
MKIRSAALFAVLAVFGTANAAEHIVWIKDGKHSATHEIAAGKFVEVCGNIAAGERYAWKFDASAKVNFDIHYHVEDLLGKPAVLERVQQGSSLFEARSKQDYCWTWVNRSKEPVKVMVQIGKS